MSETRGPAALATGLPGRPGCILAVVGLLLGVAGDAFLLGDSPSRFRAGLAAFLLGHVAYVLACWRGGLHPSGWLVPAGVVLVACLWSSRDVVPAVRRAEGWAGAGPVLCYMAVSALVIAATAATGLAIVAIGGMLFVVSDTALAVDRFVRPLQHGHLLVMVPYLLAQAFIVGGLALR